MQFDALSYDERVAQLEQLARDALAHWSMQWDTITLVQYANNAMFRVDGANKRYALRVYRPGHKSMREISAEIAWLRMLTQQRDLLLPQPASDVYTGNLQSADVPVYAACFRWIEGDTVPVDALTAHQVEHIGRFLARFHQATSQLTNAPMDGTCTERPRLDYEGLFGARSPYASQGESEYITQGDQRVLQNVADRVRVVMQQMDADTDAFGLIHGDFIYKNTLFTPAGEVAAVDFDDCGFGYYLYDVACPLLFYKPLPTYTDLKAALWRGYTAVRPLPANYLDDLETLIAGRYVASCRWVAGNANHPALRGKARAIIEARVAELSTYLNTGKL